MAQDCAVVLQESTSAHLSRISTVLASNYLTLLLCAVIILIALFISYIMLRFAISTIQSYYALLPLAPIKQTKVNASDDAVTDDDAVYADEDDAKQSASNLQDSDNSRIKSSIGRLKARYAPYNKAMAEYASRVQGRVAEDIIDETILSRSNDDFSSQSHNTDQTGVRRVAAQAKHGVGDAVADAVDANDDDDAATKSSKHVEDNT